jgi:inosose dehydratase
MANHSRRTFLKLAGLTTAAGSFPLSNVLSANCLDQPAKNTIPFSLGMASYTFRAFSFDQTLEMTRRLGLTKLTLKDMHLPMNTSEEEMRSVREKMKTAGIELSSCGVVYMKTEDEVHKAFAYAILAGIRMMVGVPDQSLLGLAERKVKETNISLAIHNHGPTDQRFPSPESAYKLIAGMDKRMGLCIDVGHTRRLGLDPAAEVERFSDRLLDVHIKDVSSADANGSTVEIGRGVIDTPLLLTTLMKLKYSGALHFEYEKDQKDPLPGVADSIGYVRGVLATL